ncbi:Na+/H+ antiporter [Novacetimonas maltaceti]|uniref:Sodium, potassium, lithium and rubidium/H(+) antiporter n=1 Tax=Novacetimonas maltaceti TaxID=1203393 RepID=A0A2S3W356_9PROT|nr:Na+/H+ antiporter [Novacetimonas maltaceti]POF63286.1 Sodium, potassium, lithium and rubidium/H(+) antiporter [Novacetimonas maltaceti]PYD61290.1 Na+/H+ antiporter [Novacetimonas maltaceti]
MHVVFLTLALLTVSGISSLISRIGRIPVPLPLIQIAIGAIAALAGLKIGFDPDMFLLLFIPPLLYADAYRMPMREFGELRNVIITLALGLVVFTTLGCGYFIHWMIPPITLPAAFALAAVMSPTDAVSVGSMIEGGRAPARVVHILHGEALLNDASGLVCFKFAVAAAMTGIFSFQQALGSFMFMSAGGIVMGVLIAWAACRAEHVLLVRGYDDPPTHITLAMMLPFAIYLIADAADCSGILAAVAGGMTVKFTGVMNEARTETRLKATTVWDMVNFTFNAVIFLLLGLQLPDLVTEGARIARQGGVSPWFLILAIIAIQLSMSTMRFIWIWISITARRLFAHVRHRQTVITSARTVLIMTVAGTRGAITLAAILSLPIATATSAGFPGRDLLVTLAAGVIICSLVLASATMPALMAGMQMDEDDPSLRELDAMRIELAQTAVQTLHAEQAALAHHEIDHDTDEEAVDLKQEAISRLLHEYQDTLKRLDNSAASQSGIRATAIREKRAELALRFHVIRHMRERLHLRVMQRRINDETEATINQELDFIEQELQIEAHSLPRQAGEETDATAH